MFEHIENDAFTFGAMPNTCTRTWDEKLLNGIIHYFQWIGI